MFYWVLLLLKVTLSNTTKPNSCSKIFQNIFSFEKNLGTLKRPKILKFFSILSSEELREFKKKISFKIYDNTIR